MFNNIFATKCFPLFHRYTKWATVREGPLFKSGNNDISIGEYIVQRRECEKCGKIQLRDSDTIFIS